MEPLGYCLRVDSHEGYRDKLNGLKYDQDYKAIVVVKHDGAKGENTHYHAVIRTEVKPQAFRARMKKIFDAGKGNGHMSIKPWDGSIDAISYLYHEDPDTVLVVQHHVTDEYLAQAKERNKAVTAMVVANKAKASWQLEDAVWEHIKDRTYDHTPGWRVMDETVIARTLILLALRSGKYVPQVWHLKAMVQRLQHRLQNGDEEGEEEFAARLASQIYYRPG